MTRALVACAVALSATVARPARAQPAPEVWKTDLSKRSIRLSELRPAGPPKDGIPSLDAPSFVPASEAAKWLVPGEPVILIEQAGHARAYPIQILLWHELVNDQFDDVPILVTYCPLCNSSLVFDRRINGRTYSFGVAGFLRNNSLVAYDRETDSLWQQVTGEAIVGTHTGARLTPFPSRVVSFGAFLRSHPGGQVMSRQTGYLPGYGRTTYIGYELGDAPAAGGVEPVRRGDRLQRVITVNIEGRRRAYSFHLLRSRKVFEDRVAGARFVIFFDPAVLSPLDAPQIAASRSVGTAAAYFAELDGRLLHFRFRDGRITDRETGSTWDVLGTAVDGPLKGKLLTPTQQLIYFEFTHRQFFPRVEILGASSSVP